MKKQLTAHIGLASIAMAAIFTLTTGQAPVAAQGFGGFGGGGGGERKLVDQFDTNKDGRLNTQERAAARAAQGASFGGGGFRRGGRNNMVPGTPGARVAAGSVTTYPATTPFYDPKALRTLFFTFENSDWESEMEAFFDTDVEVPATLVVDGKTYTDVGVGFRGASSYRGVPTGSKRSLNISIDAVKTNQDVLSYNSLNLLNANNDPTFVRTALYSLIARDYIAAPKVNFVRAVINGEDWGVYLNAQQFNKDMVREFFGDDNGARWKVPGSPGGRGGLAYLGEDVAPYKIYYDIKTKDDPAIWAKFIAFTRILNQTAPDKLEAALAPILDVDGALKFLALDVALVNSDGYWTRASDYNIYLDTKGRFHVFPHDMNEALSGNYQLDPLVSLNDSNKALRAKLLAVPALRTRYLGYIKQIAEKWMDWNRVGPVVEQYQALIGPKVEADTRKLYDNVSFRSNVDNLKSWMENRRAFLLNETR